MVKGTLGVIVCPILEDELIYSLSNDPEEKNIFLLESKNSVDISKKLTRKKIPFTLLDERMFLNGMETIPEGGFNLVLMMKDLGLHSDPEVLKNDLRETLMFMQSRVDAFALYYGLCGNANQGLDEWAAEHIEKPIAIFRDENGRMCDDCIGVAVGGFDKYYSLQKKHVGVLYYTPAMATKWREFFGQNSLFTGVETKNFDKLKAILDMCDYHKVMIIPTGLGDEEEFKFSLNEFADKFELDILHLEPGWVTLAPANRIYSEAKASLAS
ncbi:MAG: DUF1638 domain-containing protein [Candidatus Methanoplasma sp.]|jgi:hypothetical protein|nr:DUF1638 domain-containing protein [Candidatus Methanoplasma sp.]